MSQHEAFSDHFSAGAQAYLRFRPTYPAALFEQVAALAPGTGRALDCATGNGQAALGLAARFDEVIATDGSQAQLDHAVPHPRISYRRRLAEDSGLEAGSVDAVTVAAGVHWFDHDRFYVEVKRVLRPGGLVALWTYDGHPRVTPAVEAAITHLRDEIADTHWPPGFEHVKTGYETLPFPFTRIAVPGFEAAADWPLSHLLGHLRTWSSVQRFTARTGQDPVEHVEAELTAAWGDPRMPRRVRWPLHLRFGRHQG